jgi:hypothetical protein
MSKISANEAISLDKLLQLTYKLRIERFERYQNRKRKPKNINNLEDIKLIAIYLSKKKIMEIIELNKPDTEVLLSGLVSLDVIKWETPEVEVSASKNSEEPEDLDIDVDVNVHQPTGVYLTHLGIEFIKICQA